MRMVIVCEFSKGNMLGPRGRIRTTEDSKVSFHFLIDMFSFSISLRMVCGGEGEFITKELS